jgi:protein transport protein SEC20
MSSTAQLSTQLASITDSLKQTNGLITRLAQLTFSPGSEPLDEEGSSVRVELAQDIHDSLKQLEEDLELLQQDIEDTSSTTASTGLRQRSASIHHSARAQEKDRLDTQVARTGEDLRNARSAFRRAQISAKKAAEAAKVKERELVFASLQQASDPSTPSGTPGSSTADLFAGRSLGKKQQRQGLSKDELLVASSSDVTAALRRTHNLLSTELSRSRFAQETFDQSTAALAELGEHYSNLGTVLSKSRDLLGTLLRSQKSDTWYLETAFYILIATISWLIFRRILYGPFIRLPLFLWRLGIFLLNWIVIKPIVLFFTVTGVITTKPYEPNSARNFLHTSTKSRRPLIVHPSATARASKISGSMADNPRKGVPAGMGGSGAKVDEKGNLRGELSEQIGKMASGESADDEANVQRRGDGTILQERGDEPKNPKKKQFEADVEDAKHAEAEADSGESGKARVKRDEL